MPEGEVELHGRINAHGEDIAVLKSRVDSVIERQKRLEEFREEDKKDAQTKHDELLTAITSNKLATSVITGKGSAVVAVVTLLLLLLGSAVGWFGLVKEWITS